MTDHSDLRHAVAGGALPSEADCRHLLMALCEFGRAAFAAGGCSILRHDEQADELVFEAVGRAEDQGLVGRRFPASVGIAGWVLTSQEAVIVDDVPSDERFAVEVAELTDYIPQVIMAAPLLTEERAIGAIEVLDRDERAISGLAAMELLARLADQASAALALVDHIRRSRAAGSAGQSDLDAVARLAAAVDGLEGPRRQAGLALLRALGDVMAPD